MTTKVILECPAFPEGQAFGIEHANRVLKIQGNDQDGWKLKEGQKFQLNENGVIIRTSNKANSGDAQQKPSRKSRKPRGTN